jgi:hypothetical protein
MSARDDMMCEVRPNSHRVVGMSMCPCEMSYCYVESIMICSVSFWM